MTSETANRQGFMLKEMVSIKNVIDQLQLSRNRIVIMLS